MVPLIFASTSRLTNISIVFINYQSALSYIITGFPSTLPRLETLTLHCGEREVRDMSSFVAIFCAYITIRSNSPIFFSFLLQRTIVPEGPFKFTYLRNLRLELALCGHGNIRKTDALDYAYILKIAPFMETLELSVSLFHCGFANRFRKLWKKNANDNKITRIVIYLCYLLGQLVMLKSA